MRKGRKGMRETEREDGGKKRLRLRDREKDREGGRGETKKGEKLKIHVHVRMCIVFRVICVKTAVHSHTVSLLSAVFPPSV